MPQYTSPSLDNVNFELEQYSIPSLDAVDFVLESDLIKVSTDVSWKVENTTTREVEWSLGRFNSVDIAWEINLDLTTVTKDIAWKNIISNPRQIEWGIAANKLTRDLSWKNIISKTRDVAWEVNIETTTISTNTSWKVSNHKFQYVRWSILEDIQSKDLEWGIAALKSSRDLAYIVFNDTTRDIAHRIFHDTTREIESAILDRNITNSSWKLIIADDRDLEWIIWQALNTRELEWRLLDETTREIAYPIGMTYDYKQVSWQVERTDIQDTKWQIRDTWYINTPDISWKLIVDKPRQVSWNLLNGTNLYLNYAVFAIANRIDTEWELNGYIRLFRDISWHDFNTDYRYTRWSVGKNYVFTDVAWKVAPYTTVDLKWNIQDQYKNPRWAYNINWGFDIKWGELPAEHTHWSDIYEDLTVIARSETRYLDAIDEFISEPATVDAKAIGMFMELHKRRYEDSSWILYNGKFPDATWRIFHDHHPDIAWGIAGSLLDRIIEWGLDAPLIHINSKFESPFLFGSNARDVAHRIFHDDFKDLEWGISQIFSQAQSQMIDLYIFRSNERQSDWRIFHETLRQNTWKIFNATYAEPLWAILHDNTVDVSYRLQSIMSQANSGIELSYLIVSESTDTAWLVVNDKQADIKWKIQSIIGVLGLDTSWKIERINYHDFGWSISVYSNSRDISWKNLNDTKFYLHYGTELPEPLRNFVAKGRTFAYNVNTGMFLYVSEEEDFDKQGQIISFDKESEEEDFIKDLM